MPNDFLKILMAGMERNERELARRTEVERNRLDREQRSREIDIHKLTSEANITAQQAATAQAQETLNNMKRMFAVGEVNKGAFTPVSPTTVGAPGVPQMAIPGLPASLPEGAQDWGGQSYRQTTQAEQAQRKLEQAMEAKRTDLQVDREFLREDAKYLFPKDEERQKRWMAKDPLPSDLEHQMLEDIQDSALTKTQREEKTRRLARELYTLKASASMGMFPYNVQQAQLNIANTKDKTEGEGIAATQLGLLANNPQTANLGASEKYTLLGRYLIANSIAPAVVRYALEYARTNVAVAGQGKSSILDKLNLNAPPPIAPPSKPAVVGPPLPQVRAAEFFKKRGL